MEKKSQDIYELLEMSDPSTLLVRGEFITILLQVSENDFTWLL